MIKIKVKRSTKKREKLQLRKLNLSKGEREWECSSGSVWNILNYVYTYTIHILWTPQPHSKAVVFTRFGGRFGPGRGAWVGWLGVRKAIL